VEKFETKNFLEVYRFLIVGICSVSIDFFFYYLIIYLDLLDPNHSKRISFIIGAIFAFYANRHYVFRIDEKKISQYLMFSFLYFISFILNSLVHDYILLMSNLTLLSFLCATFVSTVTNFLGQKFIIFKKKQ
tara:strand:- start:1922 stop:2317 length:396 start_codon:yes stop_codon:yes gene_type:complete